MPSSPGLRPAAARIAKSRNDVVVLPLVPVTPTTSSSPVGCSKKTSAAPPSPPGIGHDDLGHIDRERPLDDERDGAALDRLGREVVPVRGAPGTQKKSAPGVAVRAS